MVEHITLIDEKLGLFFVVDLIFLKNLKSDRQALSSVRVPFCRADHFAILTYAKLLAYVIHLDRSICLADSISKLALLEGTTLGELLIRFAGLRRLFFNYLAQCSHFFELVLGLQPIFFFQRRLFKLQIDLRDHSQAPLPDLLLNGRSPLTLVLGREPV